MTPPILFFSDIPWHALYQRPQHIAAGLARRAPVLWVEPATLGHPVSWVPVRVSENLHRVSVPLFPHNARSRVFRAMTAPVSALPPARTTLEAVQRRILQRALETLGMPPGGCGMVIENFQLIHLALSMQPARLLFDYIDDAFGFAEMPAYVRALWRETVSASSAISVTAARLKQQVAAIRPGPIHLIRNGVEYERFAGDTSPRPPDLPAEGRPIIGYVGSVYPWFDFDLLVAMARQIPDAQFVIIGPGHPDITTRIEQIRRQPNIHVLGHRPYEQIPSYVRQFQAGIIPFRRNTLTESVNPVKLYEYSAAGVPTVTTFFADDLEDFSRVVSIARSEQDFLRMLLETVGGTPDPLSRSKLQAFARENDWLSRLTDLFPLISV